MNGARPTPGPGKPALGAASEAVRDGPWAQWDVPSRFGPPGRWARQALRRLLRPYEVRQVELDRLLLAAVAESGAGSGRLKVDAGRIPGLLEGIEIEEAKTPIGSFLCDARDVLVRPHLQRDGIWSAEVAALLERRLQPGMTFVDVGANFGYFSVLASRLVGPEGAVVCVEPDPLNLGLLRANLWRNGATNAEVLPLAADAETGHISLVRFPEGGAATEVTRNPEHYARDERLDESEIGGVLVPCARLDDVLNPPIDLIKIDAQFTDHHVIRGAAGLIAASPGINAVVEFGPRELDRRGQDAGEVLSFYESLGFELRLLAGGRELALTPQELISYPPDEATGDGPYLDLLLRLTSANGTPAARSILRS